MKIARNILLYTTALFFISCGDNTTEHITSDIKELTINEKTLNPISIYSTDALKLSAKVTYEDSSSADASNSVKWSSSNYAIMTQDSFLSIPIANNGSVEITAKYRDFNDSINLNIIGLNDINSSWGITSTNITTTGEFGLTAEGNFTDGVNNKPLIHNIKWYSSESTDIITTNDDYSVTLTIESTGDRNITARLFENNNTDQTITYSIVE
ncbi:MAG: hypothetical protein U9P72_07300 [Campylobacterota bacterium]|nr:hypothetical protein [Campylobacterota bacterium]